MSSVSAVGSFWLSFLSIDHLNLKPTNVGPFVLEAEMIAQNGDLSHIDRLFGLPGHRGEHQQPLFVRSCLPIVVCWLSTMATSTDG